MDFPTKWLPDRLKGKAHTAIDDLIEALKGFFNPKPIWEPKPLAIPRSLEIPNADVDQQ